MKTFVFTMNYNPITESDEEFVTEFKIPAKDFDEATQKLKILIGRIIAKKCFPDNEYDY